MKVYRQMQQTRRILHLAAQHRSAGLQLILNMLGQFPRTAHPQHASPTCPTGGDAVHTALLVLEHGDGGRKTVGSLKILINAKADVDAGAERGHRWESVLMKNDLLSDEVFALLCKHSRRDGGDAGHQTVSDTSGLPQGGAREDARSPTFARSTMILSNG